jgi:hypothetical protein
MIRWRDNEWIESKKFRPMKNTFKNANVCRKGIVEEDEILWY